MAVAVGPKGIPDDVRTVSLSRVARETGRTESEVRAALESRGYRIMSLYNTNPRRIAGKLNYSGRYAYPSRDLQTRPNSVKSFLQLYYVHERYYKLFEALTATF